MQFNLTPPGITRYLPRLSGLDNEGIGYTRHGERYLLKADRTVCVAEVVGAALCRACGVPVPDSEIVEFRNRKIFGSRLESGVELPDSQLALADQIKACANPSIFSAVLAIDLALGNKDRHWHNWLYQKQGNGEIFMRAMDFSRSWPTAHPPDTLASMRGENTGLVWLEWSSLGIGYDDSSAQDACDLIGNLSSEWLASLFVHLPVEWMVSASGPELVQWWNGHWISRVREVKKFLGEGAWT